MGFPAIESSFRFRPHVPLVTNDAAPPMMTPAAGPDPLATPASATTVVEYTGSKVIEAPMAWMTSLIPNFVVTPVSTPTNNPSLSFAPTPETHMPLQTATSLPGPGASGLGTGASIGVAVSAAVTVILFLLAIGLCIIGFRRRVKRRRESRNNKDEELSMWEAEMRRGREQDWNKRSGLWDGLRIGETTHITQTAEATQATQTRRDEGHSKKERRLDSMSGQREWDWLPAYMPRERASVASLNLPIIPIMPRTFLDLDDKK